MTAMTILSGPSVGQARAHGGLEVHAIRVSSALGDVAGIRATGELLSVHHRAEVPSEVRRLSGALCGAVAELVMEVHRDLFSVWVPSSMRRGRRYGSPGWVTTPSLCQLVSLQSVSELPS